MKIDLSKSRDEINKQFAKAILGQLNCEHHETFLKSLVSSILDHPLVDDELEAELRKAIAKVAQVELDLS